VQIQGGKDAGKDELDNEDDEDIQLSPV